MNILTRNALKHYAAAGLLPKLQAALTVFGPEETVLSVPQLAALDQFHTRGVAATADIAQAAGLEAGMTVLDLGCGIGGPARYLAGKHDVQVVGVDLSPSFVDTASYLSQRCGLSDRTVFHAVVRRAPGRRAAAQSQPRAGARCRLPGNDRQSCPEPARRPRRDPPRRRRLLIDRRYQ